jgi:hypothetical protein
VVWCGEGIQDGASARSRKFLGGGRGGRGGRRDLAWVGQSRGDNDDDTPEQLLTI